MLKRSLCVLLSCTMFLVTGCGLSSRTKNRWFGDKSVTWQMEKAVYCGNSEYLDELLAEHGDEQDLLNDMLISAYGRTLNSKSKTAMIDLLIEAGADPNTESMLLDCVYNHKSCRDVTSAVLRSKRVDIDKKDKTGHDALYYALYTANKSEFYSFSQVKLLIDAGAKPYKELFQDQDAEPISAYNAVLNSPHSTKLLLEKLLENGEESGLPKALEYAFIGRTEEAVKEITNSSETFDEAQKNIALMYLVYWGTPDQVKAVEDYWAMDFVDRGVLRFAAQTNNADMLQYIVEKSGVNLSDKEYYTREALAYAAEMGNLDACVYLCDNDCAMEERGIPRRHILAAAIKGENFDVFKTVYDYISSTGELTEEEIVEAFDIAISNRIYPDTFTESDQQVVDFLFKKGYDLAKINIGYLNFKAYNYITEKGRPVLDTDVVFALDIPNIDMLRLALEKGADPNAMPGEYYMLGSSTTMVRAVSRGTDYVKLLIDHGAAIPDDILADVYYSSKKTVEYLIEHGANTDITVDEIPDAPNGSFKTGKPYSLKDQWKAYGRDDLIELLK